LFIIIVAVILFNFISAHSIGYFFMYMLINCTL